MRMLRGSTMYLDLSRPLFLYISRFLYTNATVSPYFSLSRHGCHGAGHVATFFFGRTHIAFTLPVTQRFELFAVLAT